MKEGWSNKTLGEVCKIYNGNSINADYKKKHFLGATEGLPFIATKDVSSLGRIDYNNGVRIPNYEDYKVAPANSVFICAEGGSAGKKFAFVEKDVCFGNKLFCITPKDKTIAGKYVYYFVQSDIFRGQFFSLLTGLIGGVSAKKFQTIDISAPSLSEQQSIVDYLDSAFAKIDAMKANAEKALNEAKALFQASLKEMLEPKEGWKEKKIKEICETVTDFVAAGSFASLRENVVYNSEKDYAQLVRTTDLKSGFSKGGYVYVNEHAFKYLYRVNLDKECIILPNVGVNCGEVYYVTPSILPYNNNVLGPNAVLVRSNNYSNHFISYLFLGKDFQNKLSDITSHMAQPKFNKTSLKEIVISVPPLSEQQSIVATLDSLKSKVNKLQANYDKISQECDALKQAILRQVFE